MNPQLLEEIKVTAQRKFPGRSWQQLTPEEKDAVVADHSGAKDFADSLLTTPDAGPRRLGNVAVNNPWEGLSVGLQRAMGGYLRGKANKREEMGRMAAADLITRRDALDTYRQESKEEEEQRKYREFLDALFARYQ